MAQDFKHIETCFTCGREFQFGPHIYDGKPVHPYEVMVCMTCYQGNWDGWAPHLEEKLLARLQELGLPEPQRNAKDLLPRG